MPRRARTALVIAGVIVVAGIAFEAHARRSAPKADLPILQPTAFPALQTTGNPAYGVTPQGVPEPRPPDSRQVASPDQTARVRAVLAKDPVLDRIGVPEARSAARSAVVYLLSGTLYSAIIRLPGSRHLDSAVPAWVGPAFGVDPPEVRRAHMVADDVSALNAWVDVSRGAIVQLDTDGRPVSYAWIGEPPPKEPGD
jgi:hypothetical protein